MTARVTLYERDGCHLCDEVRLMLDAALGPDRYRRVNVDSSDELVLRYGFRVPVIAVDGVDRAEAPLTADDVRAVLRDVD